MEQATALGPQPGVKAKLAQDAVNGETTLVELAQQYDVRVSISLDAGFCIESF